MLQNSAFWCGSITQMAVSGGAGFEGSQNRYGKASPALLALAIGLALCSAENGLGSNDAPLPHAPSLMLWAWDRPENLDFINPNEVGVAYLAKTIFFARSGRTVMKPRLAPFTAPSLSYLVAVVRVEADASITKPLTEQQKNSFMEAVVPLATKKNVREIQIDFDARLSQRMLYSELLSDLRKKLPRKTRLTITALASWCVEDPWLSNLDIDEAVPMLFRMGPGEAGVRSFLSSGKDFRDNKCQRSVGYSTDEPWPKVTAGRTKYIFHPRRWEKGDYNLLLERISNHAP